MKNSSNKIIWLVVLLSFLTRIEGIRTETFAFTYDVGRDLLKVHEMLTTYDIPLIGQTTGISGLFYGPWWYYLLTVPFILSGGDPRGVVLFMVLTGVAGTYLCLRIGKQIKAPLLGLFFASLFAVSPVLIGITSQIWNPNIIPILVIMLLSILLTLFSQKHTRRKVILSMMVGFLAGLILDSEIVYGILFLLALIIVMVLYRSFLSARLVASGVAGFFIVLLPRIVFEVAHGFIMTNAVIKFLQQGRDGSGAGIQFQPIESFFSQWHLFTKTLATESDVLGSVVLIFLLFSLLFYRKHLSDSLRFLTTFMAVQVGVFFFGLSFFFEAIWDHYLIGLPVMYTGLLAVSVFLIMDVHANKRNLIGLVFILLLLINLQLPNRIAGYWSPPVLNDPAQYAVQKKVVDYVYENAKGEPFKYILYTPPVHDYTYQYVFNWYGRKRYGYVPENENVAYFYLIIEPDNQYPQRVTDWLSQREGDGEIVSEELLPGGIRVQKRSIQKNAQP